MKNFTRVLTVLLGLISLTATAQRKCATDEVMQNVFASDPQANMRYQQVQRILDERLRLERDNPNTALFRTNSILNIPVVVHIAIPNPTQVTDQIVQNQIDTLNKYFSGGSATDSLRIFTPFRTSYGRTQIRFCLAKRTPAGIATTGINRSVNNSSFPLGTHPSTVIPAWDPTRYMNVWVVTLTNGTLGYSYLPGTFAPTDQRNGYVSDYRCFGSGGAYLFNGFADGKTAVHEVGHFLNLLHPWGSGGNNTGCTGTDFCDDTPPTSGPYFGCAQAGPVTTNNNGTNACSPTANGIMWQNHMDYTDDPCMLMFTKNQTARMETALTTSPDRLQLLNSNGCVPPVTGANDAGISAIINPAAGSSFCTSTITPVVTLRNYGTNNLTSVNIIATVNGVAGAPYAWTGDLAPNASVNVTIPNITLRGGLNTVSIATSQPNGVADLVAANDAFTVATTLSIAVNPPVVEGFEGAFPAQGWSLFNPNNNVTWIRRSPGRNSSFAAFFDNYGSNVRNQIDEIRTPVVNVIGAQSVRFSFDVAYRPYNTTDLDTLTILASTDCGATFVPVYKKWGTALATGATSTAAFTNPTAAEWRREDIPLNNTFASTGRILFAVRNTNRFGNNIFVDNINIESIYSRDVRLVSIDQPSLLSCGNSVTPSVTVRNVGVETVTGLKVSYSLDGGSVSTTTVTNLNLAQNAQLSVPLNPVNTSVGNHVLRVYSWDPITASGTGDMNTGNDTLVRNFSTAGTTQAPLVETFENTFAPQGWSVLNPDNGLTWVKANVGFNSSGSAFINSRQYLSMGQRDDLATPVINYSGVDSVILSFDLSAAQFSYPGATASQMDTLEVLATTNCGATFTSVYKKWGEELQTIGDPNYSQTTEYAAIRNAYWRNERIDLTRFANQTGIQLVFRATSNRGNNIYVDNINVSTKVLPAALKQQGYLVLPTPFQNSFNLWHVQTPTSLRFVNVFNSAGQRVWSRTYPDGGQKVINVDLTGQAAGTYVIQVGYDDANRNVTQRVVKY